MRFLRPLLVPIILGAILLTIALVTRSGKLARDHPGAPINSAMREAMHMMVLSPEEEAAVNQSYPTAKITSTGLRYVITKPGDGVTRPTRGSTVGMRYQGTLLDGTPIDRTAEGGKPFEFLAGQAKVIPGWDEAVMEMTKGEKRTLIIPYWLAYGERGVKGHIPPKATLVFQVELTDVGS